ncbi:MAG: chromate reductase [Rhodothermales bacterium]|jgi:chromate reductase
MHPIEVNDQQNAAPKLVALLGSVRPGNYTSRVFSLVEDEARVRGIHLDVVDPTHMELPLPGRAPSPDSDRLREMVLAADGVILVTPEYHGSYSSVMKLVIDNLGFPSSLKGKPIALLGVAAGRIGAIKALEHLRSVASHVGGLVLPGPVSVPNVNGAFDSEGGMIDARTEELVRGVVTGLQDYILRTECPKFTLERMMREQAA